MSTNALWAQMQGPLTCRCSISQEHVGPFAKDSYVTRDRSHAFQRVDAASHDKPLLVRVERRVACGFIEDCFHGAFELVCVALSVHTKDLDETRWRC